MAAVRARDPKIAALEATRSLNPHPERVVDPGFLAHRFCDPRDLVQVKYEMVRRVRVEGASVSAAAAAFGYCRQAFYQVASALDTGGPAALMPGKPGPKGPRKLTEPVMARIEAWLAAEPHLRARALAGRVEAELGFTVHPRSIERALSRRREATAAPKTGS
jgi:transposase